LDSGYDIKEEEEEEEEEEMINLKNKTLSILLMPVSFYNRIGIGIGIDRTIEY